MDNSIAIIVPNKPTYETIKDILCENGWSYPLYLASEKKPF